MTKSLKLSPRQKKGESIDLIEWEARRRDLRRKGGSRNTYIT